MTKIDDLIETLAADLEPVGRNALRFRLASAFGVGLIGAMVALFVSLNLHAHLHQVTIAAFWVKFSYTAVTMVAMIVALDRVARPEVPIGRAGWVSVVAFCVVAGCAALQLLNSPLSSYRGLIFGYSALLCPFLILIFGLPALLANIWFLRRAAPVNPGLAGFIAGLCAGATGGWVYSWACVENGMPFIGIWYTLGMLLSGGIGWLMGRYSLRW